MEGGKLMRHPLRFAVAVTAVIAASLAVANLGSYALWRGEVPVSDAPLSHGELNSSPNANLTWQETSADVAAAERQHGAGLASLASFPAVAGDSIAIHRPVELTLAGDNMTAVLRIESTFAASSPAVDIEAEVWSADDAGTPLALAAGPQGVATPLELPGLSAGTHHYDVVLHIAFRDNHYASDASAPPPGPADLADFDIVLLQVRSTTGGGPAPGLWESDVPLPGVASGRGPIAVVLDAGGAKTPASGPNDVLTLPLGPAQAAQALEADGLALPFRIKLRADGNAGLDYSLALPQFTPNGVFDGATVRLFEVGAAADCLLANAPATQQNLTGITGINPGTSGVAQTERTWCFTATYDPANAGDYANTATVTAKSPAGHEVSSQDTWEAKVLPDPLAEPITTVGLTHAVTRPNAGASPPSP
jgi:alternate signal-mediated exported protein